LRQTPEAEPHASHPSARRRDKRRPAPPGTGARRLKPIQARAEPNSQHNQAGRAGRNQPDQGADPNGHQDNHHPQGPANRFCGRGAGWMAHATEREGGGAQGLFSAASGPITYRRGALLGKGGAASGLAPARIGPGPERPISPRRNGCGCAFHVERRRGKAPAEPSA